MYIAVFRRARSQKRMARVAASASIGATLAVALVVSPSPSGADTAPSGTLPATVSADALPTVQINGVVWSQTTVGNTVYATGSFTKARPAGVAVGGAGEVSRSNLLAYDITTGVLSTSFVHSLNGQGLVITASPDGSKVFVGGNFTQVDGLARGYVAGFDTTTGALLPTISPALDGTVHTLVASSSTLYMGGSFTRSGTTVRTRLAAVDTTTGALQPWAPAADNVPTAMVMTPDNTRVVVGGHFLYLGGRKANGIGFLNASTAAETPIATGFPINDSGSTAAITSLRADATQIYGTGYSYGAGNFEGVFAANPNTGGLIWLNSCHGDTYDAYVTGQTIYSVGHAHDCSDVGVWDETDPRTFHRALAATTYATGTESHNTEKSYKDFYGYPDSTQLDWYPTITSGTYTGQYQGAWSATGNGKYVSLGGEFPTVNGIAQQGLVRFAISSIAPNKVGPQGSLSLTPTVTSPSTGTAVVSWTTTWDQDNQALTYSIQRDAGSPIYSTTISSTFWQLPTASFTDNGLTSGSTHTYTITVKDPFGNVANSGAISLTIS
jgi:hypothetical protein